MSSKNQDTNNENKKLGAKDIAILVMSVLMVILLVAIVVLSRREDRMIAQSLQNNSEMSTDDAMAKTTSISVDNLTISEINAGKWIELHNIATESIDISGLQIKTAGKTIASVEDGSTINKDGYYVVELNSNPAKDEKNIISLCDADGTTIKSLLVPKLDGEKSYGISDSEMNTWGYMEATKGKVNSQKDVVFAEDGGIGISAPGGFYNTSFELELKCDDGEKIYYTLDGSTPTTEATLYESAIHIVNNSGSKYVYAREALYDVFHIGYMPGTVDAGCIVRAIKVDSAGNIIGEMSQAYFVGLIKDTDYQDIPIISMTTDPDNLFGYENGIYIAGKQREDALIQGLPGEYSANYYNPWKRPVRIEYYEPTKDKTFEVDGTFNITTDKNVAARQKDFTINLDKESCNEYAGSSLLEYISANGSLNITDNFEDNDLKIRNMLAYELAEGTSAGVQKAQPCSIFLDGEYWGLYCIRPIYDEEYFANNYGIKNEEIIIHNANEYNEAFLSFYSFVTGNNMAIEQNYAQVKEMMDIDSFIDYVCLNIYLGNSSFSPHNGTAWRTATSDGTGMADGKWRFISDDLSKTMYLTASQTPTINTYLQPGVQGDLLFQSLLMNEEFCQKLDRRMKEMAKDNFDPAKCTEKTDEIVSFIKKPSLASYTRFHGTLSDSTYSSEIERIGLFFETRSEYAIKYTEELTKKGGDLQKARELTEKAENEENEENEELNAEDEQLNAESEENQNGLTEENVTENTEGNTNG